MKKEKVLKSLGIREEDLKRIKRTFRKRKETKYKREEKKPNFFVSLSNYLFKDLSLNLSNKAFFKNYGYTLKKAGIPLLLPSYLSLILFLTLSAFVLSTIFAITYSILSKSLFLLVKYLLFAFILTLFVFLFLFYYPYLELRNVERRISAELPFAALYMAGIASSGVPPIRILNLLAESKEYVEVGKQVRKITNKINVYGMDLISAIKDSERVIANNKLVELFNGLSTNIITGGDLKLYLEEQAKQALTEYKVSREKFSISAGIYADLYTGLLIAGPLIFLLILILINLFGGTLAGLSITNISIIGLFILFLFNVLFIVFLQIVTPPI